MKRGKVIFFNFSLGYGFLTDDITGEDIFIRNKSLIDKKLIAGDVVNYDLKHDTDGQLACNVKKVRKSRKVKSE